MERLSAGPPGRLIAVLGSLADATRLRLLALLERHELHVGDLCEALRLPQSTVSRHLKVLADEGWLASRRDGTAHLYRLDDALDAGARELWRLARAETEGWATLSQDAARLARQAAARRGEADAFFAGAAGEWEKLRAAAYGAAFTSAAILALLPRDEILADLGCGTGDLTARIAPYVGRVLAVDRSPAMLKAARRRVARFPNVELHRADLESLPFPDAACDAALLVLALSYVPEPERVVSEAARVVRPDGTLVLVDVARHDDDAFRRRMGQASMGFDPPALASTLARAGFRVLRCEPLPPEPGARGPALFLARAARSRAPASAAA
jgi:SAM-dependent methyltransferase